MLLDLSPLRKSRQYQLLYVGQTVSFFGSMLTYLAVPYQVFELSHSPLWVGLLGAFQLVPLLFAALFGGAYADALDRRWLLVVSELALTICSGLLAANAGWAHPNLALVFAVSAAMSALSGFHQPALQAMTQELVSHDDQPAAAALGQLRFSIGAIGGPACGGLVIAKLGISAVYLIDVVSFGVSLVCLAAMKPLPRKKSTESSPLGSIAEGLRYAGGRPELIGTYVVDIVAMIFAMPMALFPMMGERWSGPTAAGWLYSSMPIGSLVMTLFSGWTSSVRRHGAAVVLAATTWGVAVIALAFATTLPAAVACLAVAGAADMVSGIFRQTIWNQTIPNELRGRLSGVEMISYMTGPLLGNARAGWMASRFDPFTSILSGGILCVVGVVACVPLLPSFWRYKSGPTPVPVPAGEVSVERQSS
jgi:MFS family permease